MMASYLLSRTLVPVMVKMLLKAELHLYRGRAMHGGQSTGNR